MLTLSLRTLLSLLLSLLHVFVSPITFDFFGMNALLLAVSFFEMKGSRSSCSLLSFVELKKFWRAESSGLWTLAFILETSGIIAEFALILSGFILFHETDKNCALLFSVFEVALHWLYLYWTIFLPAFAHFSRIMLINQRKLSLSWDLRILLYCHQPICVRADD